MSNNYRCRHREMVEETSGRGWQGTRVDDVQVDSVPLWERRGGVGEIDSETATNSY